MFHIPAGVDVYKMNLQATIAQSTAMTTFDPELSGRHHPITCGPGVLTLEEDGAMTCEHAVASANCNRNQDCINTSISILLFELVREKYGGF